MPQPYELLARLTPKGEVAGLSVRYTETVGERVYELDPVPLDGIDDPAFAAFAKAFNAAAVTERDAALAKVAEMQAHIDALGGTEEAVRLKKQAERDAAMKAKADAEAKIAELDKAAADVEAVK